MNSPLKHLADLNSWPDFQQACDTYSKDPKSLRELESALKDKQRDIQVSIDAGDLQGWSDVSWYETSPGESDRRRERCVSALRHTSRKLSYVQAMLKRHNGSEGGWLMWVKRGAEGGWIACKASPQEWAIEEIASHVGSIASIGPRQITFALPLTEEQWERVLKLNIEIAES